MKIVTSLFFEVFHVQYLAEGIYEGI